MKESRLARLEMAGAEALDRAMGWEHLPRPLAILVFAGLRKRMRQRNLYDMTAGDPAPPVQPNPDGIPYRCARTSDGSFNDLTRVRTGAQQTRLGRNVPPTFTAEEQARDRGRKADVLTPNPRDISNQLLARREFEAATALNLLAAAWIQFEVHDWFSHGKNPGTDHWKVPIDGADDWPECPMRIQRTAPDPYPDQVPSQRPTYRSAETHWWDASQVYGRDPAWTESIRAHDGWGRLNLDKNGFPPEAAQAALDRADVGGAFWLGLGLLHILFMKEHNAICEALHEAYPSWTDDDLFNQARLINAALMAKIHTVEWTPALLDHPTTRWGARINWWGILGRWVRVHLGRASNNEVVSGIPGSPTNDHGVPYALTEEFVAIYRLHPLIPDEYTFWSCHDGKEIDQLSFHDIGALQARARAEKLEVVNCLYSFGISHPGAVTLHNYPEFLRRFERPIDPPDIAQGQVPIVDLAATDILRDRERGVPRYNEFRRFFGLRPAKSFDDLTPDKQLAAEISAAYGGDIEQVDLMIGLYAERRPKGFAISDTAFRVFILMASRRLEADRFFGSGFTEQTYTPVGMRWLENEALGSVLLRHYPDLEPALAGVENPFQPWNRIPEQ